ncbi:peptide deformylase [uncultured Paraglaciecola sp.]|uniref:peptide deformylase n=1 Tax=uncultured Paraglaciecola sp. TaxID=1765024 RepID=UPI0030DD7FC9|tara:strand:+ start:69029 stop:69547 length:519 start_codon:yes stop_codon:yes gene_type:complete
MKIAQVGEEILRTPARQVELAEFGQASLTSFIDELLATMLEANGIGIAAPQVFDPRAIMIIASRPNPRYPDAPDMQPLVLINPVIQQTSENTVWEWEGCLSVPGLRGCIERPNAVDVVYLDPEGKAQNIKLEGFVARIFLHEFDHLVGKTWLDHISSTENIMANDVWMAKFA